MGVDLIQKAKNAIGLLSGDVEDGLFYLDAGAAEAFHFNGGLPALLELGARAVCSLENASPLDAVVSWRGPDTNDRVEKMVILTSKLLTDSHSLFLRVLQLHRSIKHCIIWTSVSEAAHGAHPGTSFGLGAFHDYKRSLLRDLSAFESKAAKRADGDEESDQTFNWQVPNIEFKFFPMMVCTFTRSLFVLPSGGAVAQSPLSSYQDSYAVSRGLPGVDVSSVSGEEPAGAILLAYCLQHLAAQMDLKPEIYTLGPLASVVGKMMAGLPTPSDGARRQRRSAGLILIDRTLDLVTPLSHGDSLLDRCFSASHRRSSGTKQLKSQVVESSILRPSMDIRFHVDPSEALQSDRPKVGGHFPSRPIMSDLSALSVTNGSTASSAGQTADLYSPDHEANFGSWGGSLCPSWDQRGGDYMETLIGKRTKDSMLQIRKWLQEAIRQEKIEVSARGRLGTVNVNDLRLMRIALAEKPEVAMRHTTLLQLTRAAEEALSGDSATLWDSLVGSEKILMLSAGDNTQSLALQICDIVQQCGENISRACGKQTPLATGVLALRDALTLATVAYGLIGEARPRISHGSPFPWEEEQALKQAVLEAILKGPVGPPLGFLRSLENALSNVWLGGEAKQEPEAKKKEKKPKQAADSWDGWEGVDEEDYYDEEDEDEEQYGEVQIKLELKDRLTEVFTALHKVTTAGARNNLRDVSLPVESQITAGAALRTSLIFKVLSLLFAKMDIPGLEYHSSGMSQFLKGGLGRFGLVQAKPKVSDQKLILVFVIGGINFVEVREITEAQDAIPGAESFEVLIGGTTLLTPSDMYDLVLG